MEPLDALVLAWAVALIGYAATALVLVRRVRTRLRARHPEALAELGPLYAWNPLRAWFHQLEWGRFLVTGRYRRLGDAQLDRLCRPAQLWIGIGSALLVGAGFLLVAVAALTARPG